MSKWMLSVFLLGLVAAQAPTNYQSLYLRCESQMASAQADVLDEKLLALATVVAKVEAANPGQTLNPQTWKIEVKMTDEGKVR